jgi:hypothetical protein
MVAPPAMATLPGETDTLEVSLLLSIMVTPPAGAAWDKVTASVEVWPSATLPLGLFTMLRPIEPCGP